MLQKWHSLLPERMARWQLDRSEVQTAHIIGHRSVTQVLGLPWSSAPCPAAIQNTVHMLQLVELFGSTRDEWIARDLEGWLNANEIYEGMPEILGHLRQQHDTYIVTTKQVRATPACLLIARRQLRMFLQAAPQLDYAQNWWPTSSWGEEAGGSHRRGSRRR